MLPHMATSLLALPYHQGWIPAVCNTAHHPGSSGGQALHRFHSGSLEIVRPSQLGCVLVILSCYIGGFDKGFNGCIYIAGAPIEQLTHQCKVCFTLAGTLLTLVFTIPKSLEHSILGKSDGKIVFAELIQGLFVPTDFPDLESEKYLPNNCLTCSVHSFIGFLSP